MDAKINVNNSEKKDTVEKGNDEEFERALDSERIDDFKVDSTRRSKSKKEKREILSTSAQNALKRFASSIASNLANENLEPSSEFNPGD